MVAQYIDNRPILDLCLDIERREGSQTSARCCDQEGLVLPGRPEEGGVGGVRGGDGEEVRDGDKR